MKIYALNLRINTSGEEQSMHIEADSKPHAIMEARQALADTYLTDVEHIEVINCYEIAEEIAA